MEYFFYQNMSPNIRRQNTLHPSIPLGSFIPLGSSIPLEALFPRVSFVTFLSWIPLGTFLTYFAWDTCIKFPFLSVWFIRDKAKKWLWDKLNSVKIIIINNKQITKTLSPLFWTKKLTIQKSENSSRYYEEYINL